MVIRIADSSLPKPFRALALTLAFGHADIVELARIQLMQPPTRFETSEPNPGSR
jgi:hypothetical protein